MFKESSILVRLYKREWNVHDLVLIQVVTSLVCVTK